MIKRTSFATLVQAARGEATPPCEITQRVLAELEQANATPRNGSANLPSAERDWLFASTLSLASAAAVSAITLFYTTSGFSDPWADFLDPVSLMLR